MKTDKIKILITVEGGIIQHIMTTDKNVEVVVIDYDLKGDEPVIVAEMETSQLKEDNYYEIFNDRTDPIEMEVREELKRLKF